MIDISGLIKEELESIIDSNNRQMASLKEKQLSLSVEIWHLQVENERVGRVLRRLDNLPMNRDGDQRE